MSQIVSEDPIELVDHSIIKWYSWRFFGFDFHICLGLTQACILEVEGDANRGTQTEELEPGCYVKVLDGSLTDIFAFRCLNRFYDFMSLRYDEFLRIGMILCLSCPQIILVLGWACHLWQSPPVKRIEVSQRVCHTKQFKSRLPDPSHEKNLKSLNKRKFLFFHFVSMFVIPLRVQLFKGYRQCRQPLTFCLVYTSHFAPNSYLYIPRCCMFFAVSWKKQYLSLGFPIICWEGYKKLFGAKYPLRRLSTT